MAAQQREGNLSLAGYDVVCSVFDGGKLMAGGGRRQYGLAGYCISADAEFFAYTGLFRIDDSGNAGNVPHDAKSTGGYYPGGFMLFWFRDLHGVCPGTGSGTKGSCFRYAP